MKSAVGLNVRLVIAAFTAVNVPVNTIVASSVPSPVVNPRLPIPLSDTVPFVAVNVIWTKPDPASTSATEIENTFAVSSFVVCGPGTEFTGVSFTAVIAMPRVAEPGRLMPSFAVKVIVRDAVKKKAHADAPTPGAFKAASKEKA